MSFDIKSQATGACRKSTTFAKLRVKEERARPGGENEKQGVAFLGVAFGRFNITRMCNPSRHGGRYTEPRQSPEKSGLGIGINRVSRQNT